MANKLYIANSQIVFSYKRNMNIRKRLFEFEDKLKDSFKTPFRTVAIPDEIDPNIPRFESQSVHGHSRLLVSQTRITLATNYNENFTLNYDQVKEYIRNKNNLILPLIKEEEMTFTANIIELGVHMDEDKINSFLKEKTGAVAINNNCRDFSLSYSRVYKNDYYLNIKCSKFSEKDVVLNENKKQLGPTGNVKFGISVVLDMNTKPFYEKNNKFEENLFESLENETFSLIENKATADFLKGNV